MNINNIFIKKTCYELIHIFIINIFFHYIEILLIFFIYLF